MNPIFIITYQTPGDGEPCVLSSHRSIETAKAACQKSLIETFDAEEDEQISWTTYDPKGVPAWYHGWSEITAISFFIYEDVTQD